MGKPTVFIDGQQGTTGLRIRQMLDGRGDVEVLPIAEPERKDPAARAARLNRADLAILCLPDEAAGEALALIDNPQTRVIDTSTARRVDPAWVYGLPELCPEQREAIRSARRVANTGCYPVGFILAVRPLIEAGLLDPAVPLTVNAVSGYSGGGRRMIESYQQAGPRAVPLRLYSLGTVHKHVAEMHRFGLTQHPPLFVPAVNDLYCGMVVSTPIPAAHLPPDPVGRTHAVWRERYRDEALVRVAPPPDTGELWPQGTFVDQSSCNERNCVDLFAFGTPQGVVLVGRLDNLGKGASGNAVQCMNLMLGLPETAGLV
ncbi:MAG: N-acetyl-gamma-glutamyl-phosphate reductase [Candidatus Latescibacterota bacterium]